MTEVFRQAAQSRIVTTAHGINRGAIPDFSRPEGDSDFYFAATLFMPILAARRSAISTLFMSSPP